MISLKQHTLAQAAEGAAWEDGYAAGYAAGLDDAPAPVEVEMMAEEEMVEYLWSAGYTVIAPQPAPVTASGWGKR